MGTEKLRTKWVGVSEKFFVRLGKIFRRMPRLRYSGTRVKIERLDEWSKMMKKLLVDEYTIDEQLATEISLRLSSHFMYGTYEFNPERMVEDICQEYNLEFVEIMHPNIKLKDAKGKTLNLLVAEENYGY